jgi:type 1 glutamine amidotransferase
MTRRPPRSALEPTLTAFAIAIAVAAIACGGGSGGTRAPGTAGGTVGATGAAGQGSGAAGSSGVAGDGAPGAAGSTTGTAGDAGAAGVAGTAGAAGTAGSPGTAGVADTAGAGGAAGAAGGGGAAAGSTGTGGGAGAAAGASGSTKVLIYGVTTGFRHGSITAAANAITKAAMTMGLTTEQVGCTDATNQADPTKFTAEALAQYGAVVLLANSGEPFGYPATQEIGNLVAYVQNGGALVAIEDADHCYDGQFNGHPASQPYVSLIGNDFAGHPGGVAPATCTKVGTSPSVATLPATFGTTDEIYATTMFRMDNQTVLTCVSSGDGTHTVRPVSYVREEGKGRVFYTALGHDDARWTAPMDATAPTSRLVENHVLPALLWAMRR